MSSPFRGSKTIFDSSHKFIPKKKLFHKPRKLTLVVVVEGARVVVVVGSVRGLTVVVVEVGACNIAK
jgi:hypothetical protein